MQSKKPDLWRVIKLSISGRCPNCGKGKLFAKYLKQVESCSSCGEKFGHIRADDGPAWLTILIVGHILVPLAIAVATRTYWPDWVHIVLWSALSLSGVLALLPYSKAFFIGLIWRTGCVGSEDK